MSDEDKNIIQPAEAKRLSEFPGLVAIIEGIAERRKEKAAHLSMKADDETWRANKGKYAELNFWSNLSQKIKSVLE